MHSLPDSHSLHECRCVCVEGAGVHQTQWTKIAKTSLNLYICTLLVKTLPIVSCILTTSNVVLYKIPSCHFPNTTTISLRKKPVAFVFNPIVNHFCSSISMTHTFMLSFSCVHSRNTIIIAMMQSISLSQYFLFSIDCFFFYT